MIPFFNYTSHFLVMSHHTYNVHPIHNLTKGSRSVQILFSLHGRFFVEFSKLKKKLSTFDTKNRSFSMRKKELKIGEWNKNEESLEENRIILLSCGIDILFLLLIFLSRWLRWFLWFLSRKLLSHARRRYSSIVNMFFSFIIVKKLTSTPHRTDSWRWYYQAIAHLPSAMSTFIKIDSSSHSWWWMVGDSLGNCPIRFANRGYRRGETPGPLYPMGRLLLRGRWCTEPLLVCCW